MCEGYGRKQDSPRVFYGRGLCIGLVVAGLLLSGCATTQKYGALEVKRAGNAYLTNRVRDAMDMVTLAGGMGMGATARVGPLHAGDYLGVDIVGLRGGHLIQRQGIHPTHVTADPIILGLIPDWGPGPFAYSDLCGPSWHVRSRIPFFAWPGLTGGFKSNDAGARHYLTQFEIALGLLPAMRVGVNPAEIVDFVIGWTTLDIMADDRFMHPEPADSEDDDGGFDTKPG